MAHEALKSLLETFEGRVSYMYLDTAGNVTCGVGHMIANPESALALPFVLRSGAGASPPIPATREEVLNEYTRISALRPGLLASRYEPYTTLVLTDDAIDALLDSDIAATELQLTSGVTALSGFADYPELAQDGTLDLCFNVGVKGVLTRFPKFCAACEAKDWTTAAAECHRNGISDTRNQAVREMFLEASKGAV